MTSPENPFLAKSVVNRIWFHLTGRGIVDPVDDFRDSNPSANDELLDTLAKDFVTKGFDVKHILRTIMNSQTYQLSAVPNATNEEDETNFATAAIWAGVSFPWNAGIAPPGRRTYRAQDRR